ncbi:hypothetical protein OG453_13135 [Streptomyces sp. NBC_01381]|uniref:YqeB family protein n=1 Tax=Streptomyces sp. NBC_01381 TaxID=2903845 RepID=UPI00225B5BE3|nr:hypothetical protein [Streptomyces sp. NBC_01381]MCX4667595.1 hypothetical protein [Streptomyces sp. NBC_01381]
MTRKEAAHGTPGEKAMSHHPSSLPHPLPLVKDRTTVLGYPRGDLLVVLIGMPVLGLLLGAALPPLARRLAKAPVLPWRDGITFVGSLDTPWQTGIAMAVGLAAGLVAGLLIALTELTEALKLKLTDDHLETDRNDLTRTIARAEVSAVFLDGKDLVILDGTSRQFARGPRTASPSTLAKAFRTHGYPWRESDPHAPLFHRWIPGVPALPAEAHALLAARKAALKRKSAEDARDIVESLQDLGYVVRDNDKNQYWRRLATAEGDGAARP